MVLVKEKCDNDCFRLAFCINIILSFISRPIISRWPNQPRSNRRYSMDSKNFVRNNKLLWGIFNDMRSSWERRSKPSCSVPHYIPFYFRNVLKTINKWENNEDRKFYYRNIDTLLEMNNTTIVEKLTKNIADVTSPTLPNVFKLSI